MVKVTQKNEGQKVRLYSKGVFVGYKRSMAQQDTNQSLIKVEGVSTRADAEYYLGKKVAYVYKTPSREFRVIWGKLTRPHGNSGVVKAKFAHNLPPKAMGSAVRVMMYPSSI